MNIFRSVSQIINYKTFIIATLAVISQYLCRSFDVHADFPVTILGLALVFPIVFSINSAYERRERALGLLGDFKAHALAVFYAARDWPPKEERTDLPLKVKNQVKEIYGAIREFCASDKTTADQAEKKVFDNISKLSILIQELRDQGLHSSELSRVNQFISKLAIATENLKVILHYRTPVSLRAYSKIFIYSFPILFGPFFEEVSEDYTRGLEYFMPVMFSFILVSLDNIQDQLENPFDQVGEDDVKFDVERFHDMVE